MIWPRPPTGSPSPGRASSRKARARQTRKAWTFTTGWWTSWSRRGAPPSPPPTTARPRPRISPQGTGAPNPKGLDFYNRLVDELVAAGVAPFPTLYHWDLPQALQDKGGWQSRDIPKAFGDYAGHVAEKLSDRVKHFFTINEFCSFVDGGYRGIEAKVPGGTYSILIAPGLK